MNCSKKSHELRRKVLETTIQLEQIRKSGLLDTSESANANYNRMLIEKAKYQKELEESRKPLMQKFVERFSFKVNKNKKLICDYFHC